MRRMLGLVVVVAFMMSTIVCFAGRGAAEDNAAKAKSKIAITALTKVQLTPEQKKKTDVVLRDMAWSEDTSDGWDRCFKELSVILTPQQLEQFKAEVAKAKTPAVGPKK